MIEINLSPKGKGTDLSDVGGFNLSLINIKLVLIALVCLYIPEAMVESFYDEQISKVNNEISRLQKEYRTYSSKVKELNVIQKQIEELQITERKLEKKEIVVSKIVNKRQNPFKVLKYIAENTPANLWVNSMTLKDNSLTLIGYSMNWQVIGTFIENLKEGIFFDRDIKYLEPSQLKKDFRGKNLHTFEIRIKVVRYE